MKRKKRSLPLILLCMIFLLLLSGCNSKAPNDSSQKDNETVIISETDDFETFTGPNMTAAPEGYYIIHGGFLYYVSPDLSKSTILCSKPECIHHETGLENLMDYTPCDAFFGLGGMDTNICIEYYDDFLYIKTGHDSGYSEAIYRISTDGSKREEYYVGGQYIRLFKIYEGYIYIGEKYYTSQGITHKISRFPVEEPEKEETLFETDQYQDFDLNKMKFYDGNCYFYLYNPSGVEEKGTSVYFKIDVETKQAEQLYRQSNCWLEWHDYGIVTKLDDYITYNPPKWTSRYYHVLPDTGEETELTEQDFASVASGDFFYNMDDKYLYFSSKNWGTDALEPEQCKISVYDYEGNLKAEIPSGEFGTLFWILSGTERYLFIEVMKDGITCEYYYVDKEEFDGGEVKAVKIGFSGRG